jgi:hypothetical protein
MLSIIICSRSQTITTNLSENINNSIGCDYELIIIDNSKNVYSIFEAYNIGIQKSTFDFLCFIHDDVFIHTKEWGKVLLDIFNKDQQIGLIGVAGSKIKTKMPSPWWNCTDDQRVINILQHYQYKDKVRMLSGFDNSSNVEVVVVDGVFMVMRKVDCIQFDRSMTGFHNYDMNISFKYKKHGYKIIVTSLVTLEHYSSGNLNADWVKSTYQLHKKYEDILPLKNQTSIVENKIEIANGINFIEECIKYKTYKIAFLSWMKLFKFNPNFKFHIKLLKKILNNNLC